MPGGVIIRSGRSHDVGQVLNDLFFEFGRILSVAFVLKRVLGERPVAGALNELARQGFDRRRSVVRQFVGFLQLVRLLHEVHFGQDPRDCFKFEFSRDGLCCKEPQDFPWESEEGEGVPSRQDEFLVGGLCSSVGRWTKRSRRVVGHSGSKR